MNYTFGQSGYPAVQFDRLIALSDEKAREAVAILNEAYRKIDTLSSSTTDDGDTVFFLDGQMLPLRKNSTDSSES